MDFTLDWEHLGLDQGDLFWDTALDNYQNIFLLTGTGAPQGREDSTCSRTPSHDVGQRKDPAQAAQGKPEPAPRALFL